MSCHFDGFDICAVMALYQGRYRCHIYYCLSEWPNEAELKNPTDYWMTWHPEAPGIPFDITRYSDKYYWSMMRENAYHATIEQLEEQRKKSRKRKMPEQVSYCKRVYWGE